MDKRDRLVQIVLKYAHEHGCLCLGSNDFWVFNTRELEQIVAHGKSAIKAVVEGAMFARGKTLPYEFVADVDSKSPKWAEAGDNR